MKLLFVKGKRGLAANHNGKFYFPDRNGCIKATGLYDCKITIDKDKFAFVDGKLIKTQATSIETICSLLNLDMSSVGLENRETINVFNVNNVDVLFVKNSISTHLIYINDKEQIESITSFSTNSKSSYNLRQLYSPGENMKRIISNMDIKNYLVKNGAETLSDLMLLKAATIVKSKQGKYHHIQIFILVFMIPSCLQYHKSHSQKGTYRNKHPINCKFHSENLKCPGHIIQYQIYSRKTN